MPKDIRKELPFNRSNFNTLLDQKTAAQQKILSLESNVKKLNGEILMLKATAKSKSKPVKKEAKETSPWDGVVRKQK